MTYPIKPEQFIPPQTPEHHGASEREGKKSPWASLKGLTKLTPCYIKRLAEGSGHVSKPAKGSL